MRVAFWEMRTSRYESLNLKIADFVIKIFLLIDILQVINYDQNLFKDLTNLPSAAIESFQESDDITKLLASSVSTNRPVRNILIVNESSRSLRPKRKEESNKLLLFIEDQKTLIFDPKKRSTVTVENKYIQNAIDYTHHKN